MVMLQKWSLMKGEWSFYRGGKFNEGRMALWRENGHITEVVTSMEGKWSCYRGGKLEFENGHITLVVILMIMLQRWSLKEEEWSYYRSRP